MEPLAQKWPHIDTHILPMKIHFFVLNGGLAGILSFLPIIGGQLGLTMTAIGIIYTTLPFLSSLARPLCTALADHFSCWKAMILTLLFTIIGSFFLIHWVPQFTPSLMVEDFPAQVVCTHNWTAVVFTQPYNASCIAEHLQDTQDNSPLTCDAECTGCNIAAPHNELHYPSSSLNTHTKSWVPFCQSSANHYKFQASLHYHGQEDSYDLTVIGFRRFGERFPIDCEYSVETTCSIKCNVKIRSCFSDLPPSDPPNIYTSARFWLFFLLLVLGWQSYGVVSCISDAICFELLEDHPERYGKQRLWGSVGWGVMAIISGALIHTSSIKRDEINYLPAYIIMATMLVFNILIVGKLKIVRPQPPSNFWTHIKEVLILPRLSVYFLAVFFMGAFIGIQWTYEFAYMEQTLGASPLLIGLAIGVQMFLGELPFFFFSGRILKKLGHYLVLVVSFFAFAFRYVLYSFLYKAWFILPVEVGQGPSFGLFYASMTSYAKELAPKGMEATLQGLLGSIFEFGIAVGTFLVGMAYDTYGGRHTFRAVGVLSFFLGVLYFILHWVLLPPSDEDKKEAPKVQLLPESVRLLEMSNGGDQKHPTIITKLSPPGGLEKSANGVMVASPPPLALV